MEGKGTKRANTKGRENTSGGSTAVKICSRRKKKEKTKKYRVMLSEVHK